MAKKVERILIRDIEVLGQRRALNPTKLSGLAESMAALGLKTPITVYIREDGTVVLVVGLHRLKAAELLGWAKIECFVSKDKKFRRRLWSNSENLHDIPLTKLERAESIATWVGDIKRLNKKAKNARAGGKQPADKGISRAGKQLGFSRKTISRALKIASIPDNVKVLAKKAGLDRNQNTLIDIADKPTPKAQIARINALTKKTTRKTKQPTSRSKSGSKALKKLVRLFVGDEALKQAWGRAPLPMRRKFVQILMKRPVRNAD
jgi:ParB family transcriptional regulator, chromosome partitioning protein